MQISGNMFRFEADFKLRIWWAGGDGGRHGYLRQSDVMGKRDRCTYPKVE